jgi:hypothetical protein
MLPSTQKLCNIFVFTLICAFALFLSIFVYLSEGIINFKIDIEEHLDCIWLLGTVALITDFEVPDSKFTVYFFIFNLKLNFIEIKST